jgi:hypothetical protein
VNDSSAKNMDLYLEVLQRANAAETELAALKHDMDRQLTINTSLATELERYRAAMAFISKKWLAYPVENHPEIARLLRGKLTARSIPVEAEFPAMPDDESV